MGINLAAGIAYLVLVTRPDTISFGGTAKLVAATNVDRWTSLRQFGERLVVEAQAQRVISVAFAEPRRYRSWSYYDAFSRASHQIAGGLALHAAGIDVCEVPQVSAAKTLGVSLKDIEDRIADCLSINSTVVVHWKQRVPALLVAVHVARRIWSV